MRWSFAIEFALLCNGAISIAAAGVSVAEYDVPLRGAMRFDREENTANVNEKMEGCRPFLPPHYNLTLELPRKAVVRGGLWTVVPIAWRNRRAGESKLKIQEKGSRYLFVALYCRLEKDFSRGGFRAK